MSALKASQKVLKTQMSHLLQTGAHKRRYATYAVLHAAWDYTLLAQCCRKGAEGQISLSMFHQLASARKVADQYGYEQTAHALDLWIEVYDRACKVFTASGKKEDVADPCTLFDGKDEGYEPG